MITHTHAWIGCPILQTSTQSKTSGLHLKLACKNDYRVLLNVFNTEEEFIQAAQEWEKLDWAAVDRSIGSMNKRVQQVLKKHGGHTKFYINILHVYN
jgi:hypothetical protein